ncbi:MAG: SLBB domain-containing protein [Planctomycetes bacterium]|nr:SLBB domain-containing protein [Planctomycetota bacterium]
MKILLDGDASARLDLEAHRAQGAYQALAKALEAGAPGAVIDAVEEAGLRGRGGAAFPVARKWRVASAREAEHKYVVANGGEHEPGSRKDRYLLEHRPHAILEGLLLCGYATGARHGYLYLIRDMEEALTSVRSAIDEARAAGLLGANVLGSEFTFDVEVHEAPTTYVAGEETAAIDSIEGGEGKPRAKPPYPGEAGIHGHPTTVNNVETLAHVPFIVREGGEAYAAIGTAESKGTMLFTLGEEVNRPGVYELPFGSTFRQLIEACGEGTREGRAVRAILPAYSAGFLTAEHLDVPIAHETLKPLGSSPGCGGVKLFLEGSDLVAEVGEIARFFAREQCGQCAPCRLVTTQMALVVDGVLAGKKGDFLGQVRKVGLFGKGKGNCSLIAMALAPVQSAMERFEDDFRARCDET